MNKLQIGKDITEYEQIELQVQIFELLLGDDVKHFFYAIIFTWSEQLLSICFGNDEQRSASP